MSGLSQTFNTDGLGDIGIAAAVSTASPSYTSGTIAALSLTLAGALRIDGSAVVQPISATSLPLPTGASTSALQITGNTTLAAITAQLPATLGQKASAASLAVVIASDQTAVPISAAALPLPAGAATSALQITGNADLDTISSNTTAITGQLPATLGQKASAASLAVVIASDQTPLPVLESRATTSTLTSVTASATSVSILSSNASRKGFIVTNDSTAILYLTMGATSSTTAFSTKVFPNGSYIDSDCWAGAVSGIWSAANGAARVTEMV